MLHGWEARWSDDRASALVKLRLTTAGTSMLWIFVMHFLRWSNQIVITIFVIIQRLYFIYLPILKGAIYSVFFSTIESDLWSVIFSLKCRFRVNSETIFKLFLRKRLRMLRLPYHNNSNIIHILKIILTPTIWFQTEILSRCCLVSYTLMFKTNVKRKENNV